VVLYVDWGWVDKPNYHKLREIYKPDENTLHYEDFVVPKKRQNSTEAALSLLLASVRYNVHAILIVGVY
jgi:hypothetical protein